MKLFLDCDGVLADFDARASEIFGMHPRAFEDLHGAKVFWKHIRHHEGFFEHLPLMSDARYLWDEVSHLSPTILTGVPFGGWAEAQKVNWARKTFGSDVDIITCSSRDKRLHMHDDKHNIIVDDWPKHKGAWEEFGGTFILHVSAENSLKQLSDIGVL